MSSNRFAVMKREVQDMRKLGGKVRRVRKAGMGLFSALKKFGSEVKSLAHNDAMAKKQGGKRRRRR